MLKRLGARSQYVNWCAGGGDKDAFFTNDGCHQLYMNHVRHFVSRCARKLLLMPKYILVYYF